MFQIIGPITVPAAGTPVRVTNSIATDAHGLNPDPARFSCHAALFQARPSNTGKVYIGLATMSKSTLAGVAAVLAVPTANVIPSFSMALTLSPAGIDLSDLYLDADTNGEGILLSVLIT